MHAILLAGGKGTRLWPLSRKGLPKHLISLFGNSSLFEETVMRVWDLLGEEGKLVVVTNSDQSRLLSQQLDNIGIPRGRTVFLSEPRGRNTAPALVLAVKTLKELGAGGPCVMLPCDHLIRETERFRHQLSWAGERCREGKIFVVFGIPPTYPATGYGYIEVGGERLGDDTRFELRKVLGFTEKPDLDRAKAYVSEGRYLWNSGMFLFDLEAFSRKAEELMPEVYRPIADASGEEALVKAYDMVPSISIDYAFLEKLDELWCSPARFSWSDLGSWSAVYEMYDKDEQGNVFLGRVVSESARGSLVISPKDKTVGLVGVQDLVVVDTPDSLLVCSMDDVQEVKSVAERLEQEEDLSWRDPARVERGWGYYVILDRGPRYKTKRIVVYPGKALSLQRHQHRSEHWVVLRGVAKVRRGDEVFYVHPNESTYIPAGELHKLENPGKIPLEIIEVQNGDYLEEDDIERFD